MTTPSNTQARPAQRRRFWSAMPPAARAALAAIVAFLIGFGWQYFRARGLDQRLEVATRELALARLEAALAIAVTEAQRGAFDRARLQASEFYTQAQRRVTTARAAAGRDESLPAAEAALGSVLQRRDSTVTLLSRGDPTATAALAGQLAEYRGALHGSAAAGTDRPETTGAGQPTP